jgi:hypothetical protein
MASEVTNTIFDAIQPDQACLVVESTGARVPIVASLADVQQPLAHAASSCLVYQERCVLIWSNEPKTVINAAHNVEKQMLGFVSRPCSTSTDGEPC